MFQRGNDLVKNKIHPTSIICGYRVSFFIHIVAVVAFEC
jgi:chaperonin GroEL (HSP60 family)